MSDTATAIVVVGAVIAFLQLVVAFGQSKTNEYLAETNRRLQIFWEEWVKDRPTRR